MHHAQGLMPEKSYYEYEKAFNAMEFPLSLKLSAELGLKGMSDLIAKPRVCGNATVKI